MLVHKDLLNLLSGGECWLSNHYKYLACSSAGAIGEVELESKRAGYPGSEFGIS